MLGLAGLATFDEITDVLAFMDEVQGVQGIRYEIEEIVDEAIDERERVLIAERARRRERERAAPSLGYAGARSVGIPTCAGSRVGVGGRSACGEHGSAREPEG